VLGDPICTMLKKRQKIWCEGHTSGGQGLGGGVVGEILSDGTYLYVSTVVTTLNYI
jgi:hypothetical protein